MKCPRCYSPSSVIDTGPSGNNDIRRRRQCGQGHRWSTIESVVGRVALKTCGGCGIQFPRTRTFYASDRSKVDKLRTICRACQAQYDADRKRAAFAEAAQNGR